MGRRRRMAPGRFIVVSLPSDVGSFYGVAVYLAPVMTMLTRLPRS